MAEIANAQSIHIAQMAIAYEFAVTSMQGENAENMAQFGEILTNRYLLILKALQDYKPLEKGALLVSE